MKMDLFKQSAMNLRSELDKNGYTISELSKKSGVSMSSISQYLSGRCAPTSVNAQKLANVLGCHPLTLMGFDFPTLGTTQNISDPMLIEIIKELKKMSFDQRKHLLKYIRIMMNGDD